MTPTSDKITVVITAIGVLEPPTTVDGITTELSLVLDTSLVRLHLTTPREHAVLEYTRERRAIQQCHSSSGNAVLFKRSLERIARSVRKLSVAVPLTSNILSLVNVTGEISANAFAMLPSILKTTIILHRPGCQRSVTTWQTKAPPAAVDGSVGKGEGALPAHGVVLDAVFPKDIGYVVLPEVAFMFVLESHLDASKGNDEARLQPRFRPTAPKLIFVKPHQSNGNDGWFGALTGSILLRTKREQVIKQVENDGPLAGGVIATVGTITKAHIARFHFVKALQLPVGFHEGLEWR
mmetsp:Transcript_4221/g.11800  ORF Transcript_4221/g.11800 Transcript_4221/m.11800 type:complete len:294 (-) Transcript_4221:1749-2630(-)